MSASIDLVSALYAATPDDPIPVVFSDTGEQVDLADQSNFVEYEGFLTVSPLTKSGVVFVFGVNETLDQDAWRECRLKPTAVLSNAKGLMILCWALDAPATTEDARPLADALGMYDLAEAIPLPPTNDWNLVHVDPDTYYTLDALKTVYCEPEEQPATYLDARLLSPYNDADYPQPSCLTIAGTKESRNWKPTPMAVSEVIAKVTQHRVGKKDGPSFVFADMVPGQRLKNSVKALYGVGLDIDTGTPSEVVDAALKALGVLAVRYTTHSHGKTRTDFKKDRITKFAAGEEVDEVVIHRFLREVEQWDESIIVSAVYEGTDHTEQGIVCRVSHKPMPKHRVVVPFKSPFVIADEGPTQAEAMKKWAKVPTALAELLGVPLDKSCTDPSRLFYFPRHSAGKPYEIALGGGPLFDWRSLELDNPFDTLAEEVTKGTSKSVTEEGRALGRWSMKRAHGFQIADVVEAFAPDRIRGNASQGFDIECPFDENHSNAGDTDDRACFIVNAGMGQSEFFTCSCRHESCRNKTNLDMLGKMIKDGWFEKSVLEDEQWNAAIIEDAPQPEVAKRIEREDEALDQYEAAIETLTTTTTDDELERVINIVLDADVATLLLARLQTRMTEKLGVTLTILRKYFKQVEASRNKDASKTGARRDELGRMIFAFSGDYNFDEATNMCFQALKQNNDKAERPVICHMDGDPVRLVMEVKNGTTKAKFNHIEPRALWSELNKLVTFVRRTDQGDGSRACVPREVADHVYEQCYSYLRQAPEVIYTPLFLSDGSLMITPKYHFMPNAADPVNILMIHNDLVVPQIEDAPSAAEMEEALQWIRTELLSDFPFLDYDSDGNERREPSEANALAMLITPFMRRMIRGRTPVFFVVKPRPGTGGTFLGKLPMLLFDGAAGAATRYSQNEEEMQKGLIAAVQEQRSHLFFDDVKDFNNRELLRAITQDNIGGRLLGSSKNIEIPNRFNWIGTGNNTRIEEEMRRRVVFIKLNAKLADIQKRKFRHPDVSGLEYEQFVFEHRGIAIHHILTLIQYWISTGCEPFKLRRRASFEEWSAKVGGVLQACGIEGFLDNLYAVEQDMDEAASKDFVREFFKKYGTMHLVRPADLFTWALDSNFDIAEGNNDDQKKSRFMKRLPALDGQTFDIEGLSYMVQRGYDKDENVAFRLIQVERANVEQFEQQKAA